MLRSGLSVRRLTFLLLSRWQRKVVHTDSYSHNTYGMRSVGWLGWLVSRSYER